ncbi:septal ring lytic transglycosylase RlpA family protein [Methylocapsa aurea]|uniref:septal ring lytic transglycosylase RlpA family protein n=1 Tax=Methylocapsa aurea TaxID=663610 RepID=UPI000569AFDB
MKIVNASCVIISSIVLLSNVSCAFSAEASFINASFYSSGSLTASGERFDPSGFTAASRTLPFGARLQVTNPTTGRSVVVRINDRGPFIRGRSLDLAMGAAEALGIIGQGVAKLKIARLD